MIDSGKFDWGKHGKRFPHMIEPSDGYHGLKFWETFGPITFIIRVRVEILRDLGSCLSPFAAQQLLIGIETLSLRAERHAQNAQALAEYLEKSPYVSWVSYPGLKDHPSHQLAQKYLKRGYGGVLSFGVKGGGAAGSQIVDGFKLISNLANVGDSKTLAIHPWTTTHEQLSDEEKTSSGVTEVCRRGLSGAGQTLTRTAGSYPDLCGHRTYRRYNCRLRAVLQDGVCGHDAGREGGGGSEARGQGEGSSADCRLRSCCIILPTCEPSYTGSDIFVTNPVIYPSLSCTDPSAWCVGYEWLRGSWSPHILQTK